MLPIKGIRQRIRYDVIRDNHFICMNADRKKNTCPVCWVIYLYTDDISLAYVTVLIGIYQYLCIRNILDHLEDRVNAEYNNERFLN